MPSSIIMVAVFLLGAVCGAAPPSMEMVMLEVELGATAIFPCNGSAFLGTGWGSGEEEDEGGLFLWEAMGNDVAAFKDGAMVEGSQYEGRVRLAPEDSVWQGDWSLVLEGVQHADVNMYECIVPGRRTLTNVWLSVEPPEVQTLWVNAWLGDSTYLTCEAPEDEPSPDLRFWWEKDGVVVPHAQEDEDRIHVETEGNHMVLVINQVLISDRGVYHCFYETRPSPEPRRGSPEIVRLTVLGSEHLENEAMGGPVTQAVTQAEEEADPPSEFTPLLSDDALGYEGTAIQNQGFTLHLEHLQQTLLSKATYNGSHTHSHTDGGVNHAIRQPSSSGSSRGGEDSSQRENLPWVRISIIAGVLAITATTLCILGARHMI